VGKCTRRDDVIKVIGCMGMSECIKAVDKLILDDNKSAVDANSTVQHPVQKRQIILLERWHLPGCNNERRRCVDTTQRSNTCERCYICFMYRDDEGYSFLQ